MKKIWNGIKFIGGIYLIFTLFFVLVAAGIDDEPAQSTKTENVSTLYETTPTIEETSPKVVKASKVSKKKRKHKKAYSNNETSGLVSGTCNGVTKKGLPCRNRVKAGEYYCWRHK